jgi:hypothetical protein
MRRTPSASTAIRVPLALLAAAAGLVALCLSGRWNLRDPGGPPPEAAGEGVAPVPAARA